MARTDNLTNYLTDVAAAIKEKRGFEPEQKVLASDFDTEIMQISGGGDLKDATATVDDVLYPKTFYNKHGKQTGNIQTTYEGDSGSATNHILEHTNNTIQDYREDLGYYLKINGSTLDVYSISTNEVVLNINKGFSNNYGNYVIGGAKFSDEPVEGTTYNIICNMWKNIQSSTRTYSKGINVIRFNLSDPTDTEYTYFNRFDNDGYNYNGGNRNFGVGLAVKNNYVYSTVQTSSNYYQSSGGATTYYYIDNINNTISLRATHALDYSPGTVPYMTNDGRLISVLRSGYCYILQINDAHNSITRLANFAPSADRHVPIVLDDGIIYDYKYYTVNGVIHTFDKESWPFGYNNLVLYLNGNLVWVHGNTINVFKFNKSTFEITPSKAFLNDNNVNTNYYGENGVLNSSNMPMLSLHNIVYTDTLSHLYNITSFSETQTLTSVVISGQTFSNMSTVTTTADKLLEGSYMYNYTGKVHGSMPNNGPINITPSTSQQSIPVGYTDGGTVGAVTSAIDNNIQASNIKEGVEILGVTGTFMPSGGDATSDANIQAKYLLTGYSVVSDGEWVQGTMANYGTQTIQRTSEVQSIPTGYYDTLTIPIAQAQNLDGYDECELALQKVNDDKVGYTELNYIQGTGTQYIDTNITVNKNDNITLIEDCAISTDNYAGANGYMQWTGGITNNQLKTVKVEYKNITETISVDDTVISTTSWSSFDGTNVKLGIFKLGDSNNSWHSADSQSGKIYSCKIYNNDTLVRNFIPVKRNSDDVICLYDKVTRAYFLNQGTGTFISGGVKE